MRTLQILVFLFLLIPYKSQCMQSSGFIIWESNKDSMHFKIFYLDNEVNIGNENMSYDQIDSLTIDKSETIIQSNFGSRKIVTKLVMVYNYAQSPFICFQQPIKENFRSRFFVRTFSISLNDTLVLRNKIFCDSMTIRFIAQLGVDWKVSNIAFTVNTCELNLKVYPGNLYQCRNTNNSSVTFPKLFSIINFISFPNNNNPDAKYFSPAFQEKDQDSIYISLSDFNRATWQYAFSLAYPLSHNCPNPNSLQCNSYIKSYPPYGLHVNSKTGDLITKFKFLNPPLLPILAIQSTYFKFQYDEYRIDSSNKMILLGSQFLTIPTQWNSYYQNQMNIIPRVESSNYEYKVCPGDSIQISISSTAFKWPQSTLNLDTAWLFWDSSLVDKGASFNIIDLTARDKKAIFKWITKQNQIHSQPYRFTAFSCSNDLWKSKDPNFSGPLQINARTFLIYVRPKPTVWRSHAIQSCGNVKASVDSFIELPGTWNFHWQMIDSAQNVRLSHTGKFPDFKLPHPGKWILRLTASNDYAGCPLVVEDTLNVAPFSLFSLPDTSFCSSESVTFTPIGLQGAPPFTYLWKTASRTDTAASLLFNNTSDSMLWLQVTDANNCVFVDSMVPQVRPAPIFNFGFEGLQACVGDTIQLKVPSTFVSLPRNWTPELDDTLFAVTTSGVYSLLLNDTFHQCAFADTVLIAFQDIPKADFSFAGVCNPDSVSFHYTGTQPEGNGYDFYWLFPDTMLSGKSVSNKMSEADWIPVRVQVISYTGCRDTLTQWIPAGRHVKALFSGKDICQGDSLRFLDQSTFTYQPDHLWKFGDGNFSSAQNPVHSYPYHSESKTYLVTLKVQNDFCADSITLPVNVIESPEASFTHNSNGKTVFFTPNETPSGASFRWTFGDGDSSNLSAPSHTYKADSGTYTVCLSVINTEGCTQTSCKQVYFNVGIHNLDKDITIYPNPTENLLFITSLEPLQNALLTLSDTQGKTILQSTCNGLSCTLNLKSLPKGVYTLNIENEGRVMKKVVIKL